MKQFLWCLVGIAIVPVLPGCSHLSPKEEAEEKYEKSLSVTVQNRGLMSSDEWMEIDRLGRIAKAERKLDDADFQRVIGLVQQKTSGISPSTSVVAVHLSAMNIFQSMTRASPTQKRKIISVVTPFLNSQNRYEPVMAKQVIDEFKGTS